MDLLVVRGFFLTIRIVNHITGRVLTTRYLVDFKRGLWFPLLLQLSRVNERLLGCFFLWGFEQVLLLRLGVLSGVFH